MHAPVRVLSIFVLLLACAASARSDKAPAEPRFEPDLVREEFEALYDGLRAAHYDLYARRPRDEYDRLYERMRREVDEPLTLDEVERRFQRFVAYGNVAHARIDSAGRGWETFRAAGGKAFPLRLRVVGGRVHVAGNLSGSVIATGDRVVSIDGQPALQWLDAMRAHLSADNDYLAYAQLEAVLPIHVWLARGEVEAFPVVVEKGDGSRIERTLPARTRAEFVAAEAAQPAAFELDWNAREVRVVDGVGYLRPGPFYDNRPDAADPWDTTAFRTFIDGAFERFIADDVERVVIDLRDNPGGDNSFSDLMVAWIATKPFRFTDAFDIKVSAATTASNRKRIAGAADSISKRFDAAYAAKRPGEHVRFEIPEVAPREGRRYGGRVDVLVNRHSYSNTVMVAAIVQDFGFGRILGEETADLASTYGAMETFTLPRTGIVVGYPKARILRPSGNPRARGVVPDVVIETPIRATREDVVLERALALPVPVSPADPGVPE